MTDGTQATLGEPEAPQDTPPVGTTEYTVQVDRTDGDTPEHEQLWVDVAVVRVAKHTTRPTALRRGLEQAGVEITPELRARLLDVENAHVWEAKPPEPKTLRLI